MMNITTEVSVTVLTASNTAVSAMSVTVLRRMTIASAVRVRLLTLNTAVSPVGVTVLRRMTIASDVSVTVLTLF